jgi:hypothetical protein
MANLTQDPKLTPLYFTNRTKGGGIVNFITPIFDKKSGVIIKLACVIDNAPCYRHPDGRMYTMIGCDLDLIPVKNESEIYTHEIVLANQPWKPHNK